MQSFPGVLELQKVATVELVDSSSIKSGVLQAKIFFFQGRIFSVEYPQRPKRFAELHGASLKKMKVAKVTVHLEI